MSEYFCPCFHHTPTIYPFLSRAGTSRQQDHQSMNTTRFRSSLRKPSPFGCFDPDAVAAADCLRLSVRSVEKHRYSSPKEEFRRINCFARRGNKEREGSWNKVVTGLSRLMSFYILVGYSYIRSPWFCHFYSYRNSGEGRVESQNHGLNSTESTSRISTSWVWPIPRWCVNHSSSSSSIVEVPPSALSASITTMELYGFSHHRRRDERTDEDRRQWGDTVRSSTSICRWRCRCRHLPWTEEQASWVWCRRRYYVLKERLEDRGARWWPRARSHVCVSSCGYAMSVSSSALALVVTIVREDAARVSLDLGKWRGMIFDGGIFWCYGIIGSDSGCLTAV